MKSALYGRFTCISAGPSVCHGRELWPSKDRPSEIKLISLECLLIQLSLVQDARDMLPSTISQPLSYGANSIQPLPPKGKYIQPHFLSQNLNALTWQEKLNTTFVKGDHQLFSEINYKLDSGFCEA